MAADEFNVESWTEMFSEIGLDEATMHRWHAIFESKWPEAHQSFLEWLNIPKNDVDRIRKSSREDWG